MSLTVRRAQLPDAPVIVEYNRLLALETEGKTLDLTVLTGGVTACLLDPRKGPYYLAEEDGLILGQMQITTEFSDWRNGWFWWIQSVYVRQDARGRGIFRTLYEHVIKEAAQQPDVIGLRLYVDRENHAAQKTYQKLGMVETNYLFYERYPLEGGSREKITD